MSMKVIVIWSIAVLFLSPIVAKALAVSGWPDILCIYIITVFCCAPMGCLLWQVWFSTEKSGAA